MTVANVGRPHWERFPLWSMYRRRELRGKGDAELLSVYREHGVVPKASRTDNYNKPSEDLRTYKYVRPRDLVLNKMKTWQGSLAVSRYEGIVSPAYFVAEPLTHADSRFMHHLLRSEPLVAEYRARSKGIRPNQWDLPWTDFSRIKVALPPASEQRAIADFLDTETTRIDALIAKKQLLVERAGERVQALIESRAWDPSQWEMSLNRLVRRFVDYRGATPEKSTSGVPLATAGHIKDGRLELETDPQFVSDDFYGPWMRRGFPAVGDVLMTMEAPLGQVAQVDRLPLALAQRVILMKPDERFVSGDFLSLLLRSPSFQARLAASATGSTALGIRADRLKALRLPVIPRDDQDQVVAEARKAEVVLHTLAESLSRQNQLLRERRQALITAAVTGELEVPGVAA